MLEGGQLTALGFIADQDRRAVGGLYAQNAVDISLVRREDHIELRVFQIQPGQVAR